MDTDKLLSDIKARFGHTKSKQQLKDKYKAKLTFADQGGMWTITPTFLSSLASSTATMLILLDDYDNPVKVDRVALLLKANGIYLEVMEQWHTEFTELQNKR